MFHSLHLSVVSHALMSMGRLTLSKEGPGKKKKKINHVSGLALVVPVLLSPLP